LREQALAILAQYDHGPLFTPPSERGMVLVPGAGGGASWAGAAFDPDTGRLFVPSITAPNVVTLSPPPADWIKDRYVGRLQGLRGPQGLPLFKPPFGRLTAIDLAGGDHVWMVPIGEGPRHHPRLEPLQLGRLGWDRRSFPLATRTLLFVAQTGPAGGTQPAGEGPRLEVFEKASGVLIARVELPESATGALVTYFAGEKQYIVVAIDGRGRSAVLVDGDVDRHAARLAREVGGQRQELLALVGERRRLLAIDAAEIDPLLERDRPAPRGVERGMARGHARHARAGLAVTLGARTAGVAGLLVPQRFALEHPEHAGIRGVVVLHRARLTAHEVVAGAAFGERNLAGGCRRGQYDHAHRGAESPHLVDGDGDRLRLREAAVTGPLERERAALGGDRRERDERVRGDRRMELRAEDLRAVVGAHECSDDVARDGAAELSAAIAGLHRVRDQGLDLDDLAALGPRRHVDEGARHRYASSRQAARVTTTFALVDQNEPSLISQIAT